MALYTIHEGGNLRTLVDSVTGYIKRTDVPVMPSKNWLVRGFCVATPFGRLNRFQGETLGEQLRRLAEATREGRMTFTTGRPRYYVSDYDYGTDRIRMGGIIGVWLASEEGSYPEA